MSEGTNAAKDESGHMKKLPSSTVRLIGSTQVITSPLSVVKELMENSLDASSTNIQIKLENFGFDKIEVRDNGSGIKPDDTEFMGQSHYTSKISSHNDLEGLVTYGFRGEALGSLCAVSDVAITTKTAKDVIGFTYNLDHKGQIKTKTPSHLGQGTTVVAANLFKDLPVRRQFYNTAKKKKECLKNVEDLVMAFGVIHPEVRLTLHHNKQSIWQKSIVANYRMVLLNVLGSTCVNSMEYHDYHDEEVDIEAYLPCPGSNVQVTGRTQNDRTFIFVNKRPVINKDIEKLLKKYYMAGTKAESTRYPVAFVSLTVTPSGVDVNLNPNKTQVLFHQKDEILEALEKMLIDLYGALGENTKGKIPKMELSENNNNDDSDITGSFDSSLDQTDGGSRLASGHEVESSNVKQRNVGCTNLQRRDIAPSGVYRSEVNNETENKAEGDICRIQVNSDENIDSESLNIESQHQVGEMGEHSIEGRRRLFTWSDEEEFSESVQASASHLGSKQTETLGDCVETESRAELNIVFEHHLLPTSAEVIPIEQLCSSINVGNNVPSSDNRVDNSDEILHVPFCDAISKQTLHQDNNITKTREDRVVQSSNLVGDFNEIFEHPLLQDLQSGDTNVDKNSNQPAQFTFSDMNKKDGQTVNSNQDITNIHAAVDFEHQPGFNQFKILSGGYEKAGKLMGPKGDDLSLLGQRRKSATSDSEASRDSAIVVPSCDRTGNIHIHGEHAVADAEMAVPVPERRFSISDIWSKGTGILDQAGKRVEPVKLLTARPPTHTSTPKLSISANLNRSVRAADMSGGQKTLMQTMREPAVKPNSAFELFVNDHKEIVMADNPDADSVEVKVILKQRWESLEKDVKKQYEEMEIKQRERYWQQKEKERKEKEEKVKERVLDKSQDIVPAKPPPQKKRKVDKKISIDDSKPERRDSQTVEFSMTELKAKFSGGFRMTQSQRTHDKPDLIGPIKSLGIWTCFHGNSLMLFNHWRAQETVLYHQMMENHTISCTALEKPIKLNFDALLMDVLDNLKKKQYVPDTDHYIEDDRLMKNGFRVRKVADTSDYEITQMTSVITFYGISDLKEILSRLQQIPQATLADCRPLKIINYLKGEAVRMSRQLSGNMARSELQHILDGTLEMLPRSTDTCLHGKPITHILYEMDQLPVTQFTQSQG